ncbi:MAG: hypothetical protein M1826_005865 [Phylliscum demangeonii]|nr:MAG: hypothetical protein M1826_005865 [Phylliscum demangeonii]
MLLCHRTVPAKIPKRRSRAGCIHCKEKKKKCTEERPQCDRCLDRGLDCHYEPVKPRKKRRTSALEHQQHRARSAISDPGPKAFGGLPLLRNGYPSSFTSSYSHSNLAAQHLRFSVGFPAIPRVLPSDVRAPSTPPAASDDIWEETDFDSSSVPSPVSSVGTGADVVPGPSSVMSAPLMEFIAPARPGHVLASTASFSPVRSAYSSVQSETSMLSSLALESHRPRVGYGANSIVVDGAPLSFAGLVPSMHLGPFSPFAQYSARPSRQVLLDHFCRVLSPLLVFSDDSGNALRTYVLPLAAHSAPMLHAILALSAAHMEYRGLKNDECSLDLHSRALCGLTQLIADPNADGDEAVAVIIVLVYYEIVRNGSPTVCASHLRGALSIMRTRASHPSPTASFLAQAFRYLDGVCALSLDAGLVSDTSIALPAPELVGPCSVGAIFGLESMGPWRVDAVFGFSWDLWQLVHRLPHLLELQKAANAHELAHPHDMCTMRVEFEASCARLEVALHQWRPPVRGSGYGPTAGEPSHVRFQALANHADACRHAALVYLYRRLQAYPRTATQVQGAAKQAIQASLRVVVFGGPIVARTVYRHMAKKQGMANVGQAWPVVEEIWRRQDVEGRASDWTQVCCEMGRRVILG